jgi:hypothetical protein
VEHKTGTKRKYLKNKKKPDSIFHVTRSLASEDVVMILCVLGKYLRKRKNIDTDNGKFSLSMA